MDAIREAELQIMEDYIAIIKEYGYKPPFTDQPSWDFCAGVTMAIMTLKDLVEQPKRRFAKGGIEESVEAYFSAAKKRLSQPPDLDAN